MRCSSARRQPPASADRQIDFNRDVQPILSENCYFCHGTDKNQRKAGPAARQAEPRPRRDLGKGRRAIVPGKSGESEVIRRMLSNDPDEVMPPKESHREVTPAQIEMLKQWIDEGAAYADALVVHPAEAAGSCRR